MANDWIPMRVDLHEDPAVLKMARKLQARPEHVVGYCLRFWGWASSNSTDGVIRGLTLEDVESVLQLPHFLQMLCNVGWLDFIEETTGSVITIPNFDRWLSRGAKQRLQNTRNHQMSRSDRDKSGTNRGPQNRTEQNILLLLRETTFGEEEKKAHAVACERLHTKPGSEMSLLLARVILLDGFADACLTSEVVGSLEHNKPAHWLSYIRAIVARNFGVSKSEAAELIDAADPRRRTADVSEPTETD